MKLAAIRHTWHCHYWDKMLQNIYVFLSVALVTQHMLVEPARRVDVQQRMRNSVLKMQMMKKRGLEPEPNLDDMLGLQSGEHLDETDTSATKTGTLKIKLQESYHGIRVLGDTVVVEKEKDGTYTGYAYGKLVEGLEEDLFSIECVLKTEEILQIAIDAEGDILEEVQFDASRNAEQIIWLEEFDAEHIQPRLAIQISYRIMNSGKISAPVYVIDCETGNVITSWQAIDSHSKSARYFQKQQRKSNEDNIYNRVLGNTPDEYIDFVSGVGGNEKMGKYTYGIEYPKLQVKVINQTWCALQNEHFIVINANYSYSYSPPDGIYMYDCNEGNNDAINGAFSPSNDAYFFATKVREMYMDWFGITPLKKEPAYIVVHFGEQFENAFWDRSENVMAFGDGNETMHPLTNLGITAHELSHGVTSSHSKLIYAGQSGGLNEAFSDMALAAAEFYLFGKTDWMNSADVFKDTAEREAMRFFEQPSKDGLSIDNAGQYCPGIDVHHSSGVFNRVLYILANTKGWDVKLAFSVFVKANVLYWKENSDYSDAACGAIQAASDLDLSVSDLKRAFAEVGVFPCRNTFNGFTVMSNLKILEGDSVHFQWLVPENLEEISFEVLAGPYQFELEIHPTYSKEDSIRSNKTLNIFNPEPVLYDINLYATENVSRVHLNVLTNPVVITKNISLAVGDVYDFKFQVPDVVFKSKGNSGIIVRATNSTGFVLRHNKPAQVPENYFSLYQFEHKSQNFGAGEDVLLCNPKPGYYYGSMKAQYFDLEGIDITVYIVNTVTRV